MYFEGYWRGKRHQRKCNAAKFVTTLAMSNIIPRLSHCAHHLVYVMTTKVV